MIEIRNLTPGPFQLIVRSFSPRRTHSKAFTTLIIPGHKVRVIKDEQAIDIYLNRGKKHGLIDYRYVPENETNEEK